MGGSSKIKSEPPTRSCLIQAGASLSSDLAPLACVCDQHSQITKECSSSSWIHLGMQPGGQEGGEWGQRGLIRRSFMLRGEEGGGGSKYIIAKCIYFFMQLHWCEC